MSLRNSTAIDASQNGRSRRQTRTHGCADCPTLVTRHALRCKPCAMRVVGKRPERVERLLAGLRVKLKDPAYINKLRDVARHASVRRTEKALGWCPPEYRDEWRRWRLTSSSRALTPFQRRERFLARVRADLATLSPFERQERALCNGAALVANVRVAR